MSSGDDPGPTPQGVGQSSEGAGEQVHSQLVEALMLLLIEKGVLTKNDALSVVRTVAEVQQGVAVEAPEPATRRQANIEMLRRLYSSFEAIADGAAVLLVGGENVHQIRPPSFGGRPEFPGDD